MPTVRTMRSPMTDIDEILPGLHGEPDAGLLRHGHSRGVRPARRQLGEWSARAGEAWPASAAGIHCARLRSARHEALQVASRARSHARSRARSARRRTCARCASVDPAARNMRSRRKSCTSSAVTTPISPISPIVGGGANSCILHYRENDQPLRDGEVASDRCGVRVPVLRLGHHAYPPRERALQLRAARGLRGRSGGAIGPRSPRCGPATPGTIRIRPPCA